MSPFCLGFSQILQTYLGPTSTHKEEETTYLGPCENEKDPHSNMRTLAKDETTHNAILVFTLFRGCKRNKNCIL